MSINLTTTHTKHKPIYIYTYRQKPLKLLKIKKGPIDLTAIMIIFLWLACKINNTSVQWLTNVDMTKLDKFVDNNCQYQANDSRVVVGYVDNPCNGTTDWYQQPVEIWLWWQLTLQSVNKRLIRQSTLVQIHHNYLRPNRCKYAICISSILSIILPCFLDW